MRAAFTAEELRAIAFGMSSRPTISTTNDWRVGMSKALTVPSRAATDQDLRIVTWPESVSAASTAGEQGRRALRPDQQPAAIEVVGQRAADRGQEEDRRLADEAGQAEQERRVGQPIDEPRLRHGLQPRPDERDRLAAEVEAEVAVLERAKTGHRSLPPP